jgi:hypothetical protein
VCVCVCVCVCVFVCVCVCVCEELLRKALVLGDLGVNDALNLSDGCTSLHIAASYGELHVSVQGLCGSLMLTYADVC